MSQPVVIVDYDPRWPALYEKEKARLQEAIGDRILAIAHIGSTAVPGLAAKPIVDIFVGVRERAAAEECVSLLSSLGYTNVTPEDHPEWYYCLGNGPSGASTFHVHLVKYPSAHWERHLLFRDYLRAHAEVAEEYCRLKRELAARHGSDRVAYTEAKSAFIASVEAQARAWFTKDLGH